MKYVLTTQVGVVGGKASASLQYCNEARLSNDNIIKVCSRFVRVYPATVGWLVDVGAVTALRYGLPSPGLSSRKDGGIEAGQSPSLKGSIAPHKFKFKFGWAVQPLRVEGTMIPFY